MINRLATILIVLASHAVNAQQEQAFEQYFYVREKSPLQMMPIVHVQSKTNWYGEARYNYEDFETVSFYGGKMFIKEKKASYSFLPMLGVVMGKYKGWSLGLNVSLEYKDFFFYSQSQYTFSVKNRFDNFFYSWSEAGYEIWKWLYAGVALQNTTMYSSKLELGEKGFVVGFSVKKWVFPVYIFNPGGHNQYLIMGINIKLE